MRLGIPSFKISHVRIINAFLQSFNAKKNEFDWLNDTVVCKNVSLSHALQKYL